MQNLKSGDLIPLKITELAYGGQALGKLQTEQGDFVVFVQDALPGQVVQVRIIKKKKNYAEAKLVSVLERSPQEVQTPYQRIAGAPFAQLPIDQQILHKKSATLEMFKRVSNTPHLNDLYDTYIESPQVWHYRNKMEYSFSTLVADIHTGEESEGFALGFKKKGQWWSVEPLNKDSGLFDAEWENNLHLVRAFCEASGLPAWNPAKSVGFYRFLAVRKTYAHDKLLLNLITTSTDIEKFDAAKFVELVQSILKNRVAGILHTINNEVGDTAKSTGDNIRVLYGDSIIHEQILGLNFGISMQSFFQTNPLCAEKLYSKAIEYTNLGLAHAKSSPIVMDLFCGTGTITQLLSRCEGVKEVIGVDIVPEAIEDAKINAQNNKIEGLQFFAADVGKFLAEFPQYQGKIGVIVLDPPRAGIAPKTLDKIIRLKARSIVYISCNPATQARDTEVLKAAGYELEKYALVDQFPHTSHIESIGLFLLKK